MAVSSNNISWRGGRAFTEASDLGWGAGHWPERFDVVSAKTGVETEFERIAGVHKHGELQGVRYRGMPNGKPIYLMVFND